MKVDIVLGAQYGGEGKSKFVRYLTEEAFSYDAAVKLGGYTNTPYYDRKEQKMKTSRMIPVANNLEDPMLYMFPKCCYIDLKLLKEEARERGIEHDHIMIDPRATIRLEDGNEGKVKDIPKRNVTGFEICEIEELFRDIEYDEDGDDFFAIIEAQGGWALAKDLESFHKGRFNMPVPTMTASGILSLLELSPSKVRDTILVSKLGFDTREFKAKKEQNGWNFVCRDLDSYYPMKKIIEDKDLNPTMYNYKIIEEAIIANDPTITVLNFLDIVDDNPAVEGLAVEGLSDKQMEYVEKIEKEMGTSFDYVGNGSRSISHLEMLVGDSVFSLDSLRFLTPFDPNYDEEKEIELMNMDTGEEVKEIETKNDSNS